MNYRVLSKHMPPVSILGFGCMRFYRQDGSLDLMDKDKPVDEKLAHQLMDRALEMGVNYYDTAYIYLGGMSESILGRNFQGAKRQKAFLATKLPVWKATEHKDYMLFLDEQLKRLQTDYIDYYLVHSLTGASWQKAMELDILPFLDQIKASGKVRSIGFSFHDLYRSFEPILYAWDWDFCQLQLNYLDTEYQAGLKGMYKAHEKNMGIISMEPLLGGKLATGLPQKAYDTYKEAFPERTPAEWALRWVWNFPEIAILLSGMNSMDQVEENCKIASTALPSALSQNELELIQQVKAIFDERIQIHCAACAYCMPCPYGVAIPLVFSLMNEAHRFDNPSSLIRYYQSLSPESKASQCVSCGECLDKCPHHLDIPELMKKVNDFFTQENVSNQ